MNLGGKQVHAEFGMFRIRSPGFRVIKVSGSGFRALDYNCAD